MLGKIVNKAKRLVKKPVRSKPVKPTLADGVDERGNRVVNAPVLRGSKVDFKGSNNILYCDSGVELFNTVITFHVDNAVVYLRNKTHYRSLRISVGDGSVVYIGTRTSFNRSKESRSAIRAMEQKNVIIGDHVLLARSVTFRTSDAHGIFECGTGLRINPPRSIYVGDHVWFAEDVTVLKGTTIGSGTIIGGHSLVTGGCYPSNTVCAGSPAKVIKRDVFFEKPGTNLSTQYQQNAASAAKWIYGSNPNSVVDVSRLDCDLAEALDSTSKLELIEDRLVGESNHDRFYVS